MGAERAAARKQGEWKKADAIRQTLDEAGFQTQDHVDGSYSIVCIRSKLQAQLDAEKRHILKVYTRGEFTIGNKVSGCGGIAILLRRAAKKDNLPQLTRLLRAALLVLLEEEDVPTTTTTTTTTPTIKERKLQLSSAVLNIGNLNHKCALHFGAQNAGPNMVRFLLRNGADVNSNCLRGQTPICFAIAKRRYRNVEVLLEAGATLHVRTVLGETPLDLARVHIEAPRMDLLQRLELHFINENTEKGNDEQKGNRGNKGTREWLDFTTNPMAILNQCSHAWGCKNCQQNARAMARGDSPTITSTGSGKRRLNKHDDIDDDEEQQHQQDKQDKQGNTNNRDETVEGDADEQWDKWVEHSKCLESGLPSKIRKAAASPDPLPLQILLKGVKEANHAGASTWHRYLHTQNTNNSKQKDSAPYYLTSEQQRQQQPLLPYSTIVESPSPGSGRTALMLAAWRGCVENVQLLLEEGAEINRYTQRSGNYGKTPLFYACTRCRDDIVLFLLKAGASVLIVNNKGQTPRSLAVSHLTQETLDILTTYEEKELAQYATDNNTATTTTTVLQSSTSMKSKKGNVKRNDNCRKVEEEAKNKNEQGWLNFRASHSDGVAYGDLDIRFLDYDNIVGQRGWDDDGSTRVGTYGPMFSEYLNRNVVLEGSTGGGRTWKTDQNIEREKQHGVLKATTGDVCIRPTTRYKTRLPHAPGAKQIHETRLPHAQHVRGKEDGKKVQAQQAQQVHQEKTQLRQQVHEKQTHKKTTIQNQRTMLPWVVAWMKQVEERKTNGTKEEKQIREFINERTRQEEERQRVSMKDRLLKSFWKNSNETTVSAVVAATDTNDANDANDANGSVVGATATNKHEQVKAERINIARKIGLHICTSIKYDLGGRKNRSRPPWVVNTADATQDGDQNRNGGGEASYQYLKQQVTAALCDLIQSDQEQKEEEQKNQENQENQENGFSVYEIVSTFLAALDLSVVRQVTRALQEKDTEDRQRMSSGEGNGTNLKTNKRHRSNVRGYNERSTSLSKTTKRNVKIMTKLFRNAFFKALATESEGSGVYALIREIAPHWSSVDPTIQGILMKWFIYGAQEDPIEDPINFSNFLSGLPKDIQFEMTTGLAGTSKRVKFTNVGSAVSVTPDSVLSKATCYVKWEDSIVVNSFNQQHQQIADSLCAVKEGSNATTGGEQPMYYSLRDDVLPYVLVQSLAAIDATKVQLQQALQDQKTLLLGVDSEWGEDGRGCTLVQIGTVHHVWLLDLMCTRSATNQEISKAMLQLLGWIFEQATIIKLGFSFDHDLEQLEMLLPDIKHRSVNICDLQQAQPVQQVHATPLDRRHLHVGLSTAVEQYLGLPLDKREQCSEWCQRPLRPTQLSYAALDAVVLVDLAFAMHGTA